MEQQPPSQIEELEHLVSNLRRDLQVAHDRLTTHKSALEKARGAFGQESPWSLLEVLFQLEMTAIHLSKVHDCDCQGHENASRAVSEVVAYKEKIHKALAAINEVLK